ncbi:hypothetical protein VPH35_033917 [Triticum aestivum]
MGVKRPRSEVVFTAFPSSLTRTTNDGTPRTRSYTASGSPSPPPVATNGTSTAAAPFLGEAPPSPAGHRRSRCEELRRQIICHSVLCLVVAAVLLGGHFYDAMVCANIPSFTVHLAGLDAARPARVVSPAFNLTIRINKTCADRAHVVVSYADVALGWARAEPHDCAGERPGRDVAVVAQGKGWGSRGGCASAWRRSGGGRGCWSSTSSCNLPDLLQVW